MINRRQIGIAAGMTAAVMLTAGALIASSSASAEPAVEIGALAPAFTGETAGGETVSLADYAGRTVVLEWTNHGCPFVQKHYADPHRNMQALQADAAEDGVVWLSVISSAPGKQGHVSAQEAVEINDAREAAPATTQQPVKQHPAKQAAPSGSGKLPPINEAGFARLVQDTNLARHFVPEAFWPDHAVFLGPADPEGRWDIRPEGVCARTDLTDGEEAMLVALALVLERIPADGQLAPLPPGEAEALGNWEAEKHRRRLDQQASGR